MSKDKIDPIAMQLGAMNKISVQTGEIEKLEGENKKLRGVSSLSLNLMKEHFSYHVNSNSPLCKRCKSNLEDAVKRLGQALKESKE